MVSTPAYEHSDSIQVDGTLWLYAESVPVEASDMGEALILGQQELWRRRDPWVIAKAAGKEVPSGKLHAF